MKFSFLRRNAKKNLGVILLNFLCLLVMCFSLSFGEVTNTTNQFLEEFYRGEETKERQRIKTPNPFVTTLKIILYIGILGGGAFLLVRWFVKKTSIPQSEDSQFVEVILTKMIGMNSYIHIVKIINDYYILSQSNEVRLLEKITDKERIDFIELNKEKMKPKDVKFIDILGNVPSFKKTDKLGFLKTQKEKLKKF
ncbi:MAG: flagellar biosynthetic protein FliO [Brevinematia bacterium]